MIELAVKSSLLYLGCDYEHITSLRHSKKKIKKNLISYKIINENDDFFDEIYSSHSIKRVDASRMINSNGAKRGKIKELLISNF